MRTIGILGGMSWESTATYYQLINQHIKAAGGGLRSAPLLMHSFDFQSIADLQAAQDWDALAEQMGSAARGLANAGAQAIVIATNTMHKLADAVEAHSGIPVLHIADATAAAIQAAGLKTVGLLATRFTMEQDFYRDRLEQKHSLNVLIPTDDDRTIVHRVIYEELCQGSVLDASRIEYQKIIAELAARGAQGVILGCTEIGMLISPDHSPLPVFDTTPLHARMAADFILNQA